jgi:hypothetical protein
MIPKLVDSFSGDVGSSQNNGIGNIEDSLYADKAGKIVITNKNNERASAIIVSDDGIKITDSGTTTGISIKGTGVVIQGAHNNTSKAENIRKGEYSENPRSNRIFTYQETVLMESVPKQLASAVAGAVAGVNLSTGMDGMMPIITDISAGPLPHTHTISMKHTHRVEPAYLYRIPPAVAFIAGAMAALKNFSKL